MASCDEDRGESEESEENKSRPIAMFTTQGFIGFGGDFCKPFTGGKPVVIGATGCSCEPKPDEVGYSDRIDNKLLQDKADVVPVQTLGQDDFSVMLGMHRDLMVSDMAGTKTHVIKETDKGEGAGEERVQPRGGKWGFVTELVDGDGTMESSKGAVDEECQQHQGERPEPVVGTQIAKSQKGQGSRNGINEQRRDSLSQPLGVTFTHELAHDLAVHLTTIPTDIYFFRHGGGETKPKGIVVGVKRNYLLLTLFLPFK